MDILNSRANIAVSLCCLGRHEEALALRREIYARIMALGPTKDTLLYASNLSESLVTSSLWAEAKQFINDQMPLFEEVHGPNHELTLKMRWRLALALCDDTDATLGDLTEATAILEDVFRRLRRLLGDAHPLTAKALRVLEITRADLAKRQRILEDLY